MGREVVPQPQVSDRAPHWVRFAASLSPAYVFAESRQGTTRRQPLRWDWGLEAGDLMSSPVLDNIVSMSQDMEKVCRIVRTGHFSAAGLWENVSLGLGLFAVIVGVVGGGSAGTGAFGSVNPGLAAVFAATAGLAAGAASFLKPSERADSHKKAGDSWSILRDKWATFWRLQVPVEPDARKLAEKYEALRQEKENVTKESPVLSNWFFNQARATVERGDRSQARRAPEGLL